LVADGFLLPPLMHRNVAVPVALSVIVEGIQDYAILTLDPDGWVTTWSTRAQRIKGYAPEEIIGRHFSLFYPPEDLAADKPGLELRTAALSAAVTSHDADAIAHLSADDGVAMYPGPAAFVGRE
jgi:PAS domain-containing protein